MFERFSKAARETVVGAQAEARTLGHSRIGTEHLLLSMISDGTRPVAALLAEDGVDHARVQAEVTRRVGRAPDSTPEPLADTDDADAEALRAIGIDIAAVRRAIEENFGPEALRFPPPEPPRRSGFLRRRVPTTPSRGHIPFSPQAKKTLELSLREAVRLKHNYIGPEHLLLGIVRESRGLAARILVDSGVDLAGLRARTEQALMHPAT